MIHKKLSRGRNTTITSEEIRNFYLLCMLRPESHDRVFCTIFLHQCFLSYHTWMQFVCLASCQTEASGFFSKQIAETITHIFFAVKAFTQLLRNFFEFAAAIVILCASSIQLFLVYQNNTSTFTKAKSCSYSNK